jgi:hypothetical protein
MEHFKFDRPAVLPPEVNVASSLPDGAGRRTGNQGHHTTQYNILLCFW